jgi:hypothetical protein
MKGRLVMEHYAAIRLSKENAGKLAAELVKYLTTTENNEVDIVMDPGGNVSIQDDGVVGIVSGTIIDFGSADGSENVLDWITQFATEDWESVPCFICGRTEVEHKNSDYNYEGMCTRTDLRSK